MDRLNFSIDRDERIWFTSDLHFGHRNMISFKHRPYADEKEMGQALVENWNKVVRPNEKVFCLGDFSWWNDRHGTKRLINRLNGEIYIVPGNHDKLKQFELCDPEKLHICSDISYLYLRPTDPNDPRFETKCYEIALSHFPLLCYAHSEKKNVYNFFGHIHSEKGEPMSEFGEPLKLHKGRQYDAGADRNNYTPVEFFEVLRLIKEYPYWDLH